MTNEKNEKNEKENVFDKAAKEAEEQKEISNEVPTETEDSTPKPAASSTEEEIDVDNIDVTDWIVVPKEIGEKTPIIKVEKFSKKPGRLLKVKSGKRAGETFWSGLQRKDKATGQTENCEEYNIRGTDSDGMDVSLKIGSWEMLGKVMSVIRYCKRTNVLFKGQKIQFERVAKGADTAGENWVLHIPSLKLSVVGQDNEIKTEA